MKKNIATLILLCTGTMALFCFEQADLTYIRKNKRCSTQSCDISRADLRKFIFTGGKYRQADFSHANIEGRNLTNTEFIDTDLTGTNMKKTILKGTNFTGANLTNTNFKGAQHWKSANTKDATFCNTIMPDGKVRNDHCK